MGKHPRTWGTLAVLAVGTILAVGLGASPAPFQRAGTAALAAGHSIEVTIVAAQNGVEFGFNGYQKGSLTLIVPVGSKVIVNFENVGKLPHSLVVLPAGASKAAAPPTVPTFAGAATKDPAAGLLTGGKETITFEASKPGTYEFLCAVRAHALAGPVGQADRVRERRGGQRQAGRRRGAGPKVARRAAFGARQH